MTKEVYTSKIFQIVIPIIVLAILLVVWVVSYYVGLPKYDVKNSPQNYGSIIQGMSALLGVVLAAAIFRIQSLENRVQSLEQSTLDYVYKIIRHTYPEWDSRFEENINNKSITDNYFKLQLAKHEYSEEEYKADRDIQQKGLTNNLIKHSNLKRAINSIKHQVMGVSIILITPIALSFILLMSTDFLIRETNFFMISFMIYLSIVGIVLLLSVILQSIFQKVDS
jgi:hypothetical protein